MPEPIRSQVRADVVHDRSEQGHGTAGHRPYPFCTCGLAGRMVELHDRRVSTRWGRFLYWLIRKTT